MIRTTAILLAALLQAAPLAACSICGDAFTRRQTLREQFADAKIVLHGTLHNPRPAAEGYGGTTELHVKTTLKADPAAAVPAVVIIPRYLPVLGDTPPEFLFFCTVIDGKLDPYHGVPAAKPAIAYLEEAAKQTPKNHALNLAFYFRHLESEDSTIAADAFHEFAKASDRHIHDAATAYDRAKLRGWIADAAVPEERIGVYALLLGLSGTRDDAAWLASLFRAEPRTDRIAANLGGLLAGLATLDPDLGWPIIHAILGDADGSAADKLNVIGCVRYFQAAKPDDHRDSILKACRSLIDQPDFADMAIDDLRRWGWWDLTDAVIAKFGTPGYDSPLMKRGIARYALGCPKPAAKELIENLRKSDPKLIARVESSIGR